MIDEIKSYGQVEVDIKTQNDEACITILDNGIGLPKNVNRLFEPYVTIKKEGTGLGLSIVKRIIEDHLGSLFLLPGRKMKGCDHFGAEAKIILPTIDAQKQVTVGYCWRDSGNLVQKKNAESQESFRPKHVTKSKFHSKRKQTMIP